MMFDEIVSHKSDDTAIDEKGAYIILNGKKHERKVTKGWSFICVQWKDRSTSWEPISDMKHSYPLQTTEYAVMNNLDKRLAFRWWVDYTIKKRDCLIKSASNKRYHKRTQIWNRGSEIFQGSPRYRPKDKYDQLERWS